MMVMIMLTIEEEQDEHDNDGLAALQHQYTQAFIDWGTV